MTVPIPIGFGTENTALDLRSQKLLMNQQVVDSLGVTCLLPPFIHSENYIPTASAGNFLWHSMLSEKSFLEELTGTATRLCELLLTEIEREFGPSDEYAGIVHCVRAQVELLRKNRAQAKRSIESAVNILSHSEQSQLPVFCDIVRYRILVQEDKEKAKGLKAQIKRRIRAMTQDETMLRGLMHQLRSRNMQIPNYGPSQPF